MVSSLRCSRGVFQIPAALALFILAISWIGAWSVLHQWRGRVALQLRLDECVGKTARLIERDRNRLERSNHVIQALRASILAATVQPELRPPLVAALRVEFLGQELLRKKLLAQAVQWLVQRGCGSRADIPLPFAASGWFRLPDDWIGPRPLQWDPGIKREVRLVLSRNGRVAAARVYDRGLKRESNAITTENTWQSEWVSGHFGPSLP